MEKDYNLLKEFWDKCFVFDNNDIQEDSEIWIQDHNVISLFRKFININSTVLDYGSGSGYLLTQINQISPFKQGLGIDTSINGVKYGEEIALKTGLNHIKYLCGDETELKKFPSYFDFIVSINVLDVVPDEITEAILVNLSKSLKDNGTLFIGLNHDFTEEQLINLIKLEKNRHYFYKDGILRANKKSTEEWKDLFCKYFKVIDTFTFYFVESEKGYQRAGFLLQKHYV